MKVWRWFRSWPPLGIVYFLGCGDVSESEIDFGPRGDLRYFNIAGGNRFGERCFGGGTLTAVSETVVMSGWGYGIGGRDRGDVLKGSDLSRP